MATRTIHKVHASASTYIDPLDCDSIISHKVVTRGTRSLYGSVQLSDCNRKIEWYFGNSKSAVAKVDKAIEALQAFRADYVAAQAVIKTERTRKK
jgi:hypothetical protein